MKNKNSLFWFIGLLAFIALMCSGFAWLFNVCHLSASILNMFAYISGLILVMCAVVAGWLWLQATKMNKTLKTVLTVFFILFAVLAILGIFHVGY